MSDVVIYPVAADFIPYGSLIRVDGLRARAASADEANGVALNPSFKGESTGYPAGSTIRAQPYPVPPMALHFDEEPKNGQT